MGQRGPRPRKAEAIARAALELFVEHGVKGATTREIARRAKTTEGSLYRYYAGKGDLARRVHLRCLVEFGSHVAAALEGVCGSRARLDAFVRAYVEYALAHPLEHAFVNQAHVQGVHAVPEAILRPRRVLLDILHDGMRAGEFATADTRFVAPLISGGLSRACEAARDCADPDCREQLEETMTAAVARLVLPARTHAKEPMHTVASPPPA